MRETRQRSLDGLEVRKDENGRPVGIAGYALRFYDPADSGTEFRMTENVVERIMPGSVRFADDVLATFNHNSNQMLGRTSSNTARFAIDQRGVRFDIDLPDTTTGRDVAELVSRGDLSGSSFAFQVNGEDGEDVRKENGEYVRELRALTFYEGGPVATPAYDATSVNMRSIEAAQSHDKVEKERQASERASRLRQIRLTDTSKSVSINASTLPEVT